MIIKTINIKGFRSIQDESLTFQSGLTTLVGENNVGKSSIGLALNKLFTQATIGNDQISKQDYPYGREAPLTIEATLELTPIEISSHLISKLTPDTLDVTPNSLIQRWFSLQGSEVRISLTRPSKSKVPYIYWGELRFYSNQISRNTIKENMGGGDFFPFLSQLALEESIPEKISKRLSNRYTLPTNIVTDFGSFVLDHFKLLEEFRLRAIKDHREAGVTESLNGSETANVLLTLKNHADPNQKARYGEIVRSFQTLFSHYTIDAVESTPGSNIPDVQFYEKGRREPLSIDQLSSGINEILTLITNLIAREGLVFFLEHPELHLHPHGIRWLRSFLLDSSERNQIIIVTHDTHLVDPKAVQGLRRFWWVLGQGTKIYSLSKPISPTESAQMETALRYVSNREIMFARAVLLVEDESLREFLIAVAPKLGYDIDASGVSIVFTSGHGGHRHFHTLLDALGIPHVNFRDKSWGNNPDFPSERFFSLGTEFEDFIDSQGLAEIRRVVVKEAGKSHRRPAALLGARLEKAQVPGIFNKVLETVVNLATGKPATY